MLRRDGTFEEISYATAQSKLSPTVVSRGKWHGGVFSISLDLAEVQVRGGYPYSVQVEKPKTSSMRLPALFGRIDWTEAPDLRMSLHRSDASPDSTDFWSPPPVTLRPSSAR